MNHTRFAIAGLALFAAACSSGTTGGDARPGATTETPTSTSSRSAGDTKLADVRPCELISSSEATQLGLTAPPEARKAAGAETCEWIDKNGGLTVALQAKTGANELNYQGDTKAQAKFGRYDGFTVPAAGKTVNICHAVIAVAESSSVQLVANAGVLSKDTAKACGLATKSAELIAAKLP